MFFLLFEIYRYVYVVIVVIQVESCVCGLLLLLLLLFSYASPITMFCHYYIFHSHTIVIWRLHAADF